jgi:SP family general alpha glucoside:H+ symporter-like MFS transporter
MENEKADIEHIERQPDSGWENVSEDAKQANFLEHSLGFFEGVKKYPLAITWSLLVSMIIVAEGYDTILIGNFFGYPSFIQKYGSYYPGIGMQLSGPWQVGLNNAAQIGPIIGAFANDI